MKKIFKKILHKYVLKSKVFTVYLRGRLSEERQKVLDSELGKKVLNKKQLRKLLSNTDKKVIVEIGFGNGSHIVSLAERQNDRVVVGVEMFREGLVKTIEKSIKKSLNNIFLIADDARDVLDILRLNGISGFYVLFPDPWPKARHNKRRLLKKTFFENMLNKLVVGGEIVVATDWAEYANEIEDVLNELQKENKGIVSGLEPERQKPITETTFAKRAQKEGRGIYIRKFVKAE